MKRVAVFGNAGAGKSTLARELAALTGLPLVVLDMVQFPDGGRGAKLSNDEFAKAHAELLRRDVWVIDGFGTAAATFERAAVADTLVYVDLPLATHYWWVTKRLAKGLFRPPPGWPADSPLWTSTLSSYKVIGLCHRKLTPRYRQLVVDMATSKRVHHLRSIAEIKAFLESVKREVS